MYRVFILNYKGTVLVKNAPGFYLNRDLYVNTNYSLCGTLTCVYMSKTI